MLIRNETWWFLHCNNYSFLWLEFGLCCGSKWKGIGNKNFDKNMAINIRWWREKSNRSNDINKWASIKSTWADAIICIHVCLRREKSLSLNSLALHRRRRRRPKTIQFQYKFVYIISVFIHLEVKKNTFFYGSFNCNSK